MYRRVLTFSLLAMAGIGLMTCATAIAQEKTEVQNKTEKQDQEKPKPVAVGEKAPDFELETFDDKTVKLSDRFGEKGKPVVLLFSRANW